jgi:hypothetical protein
MKLMIALIFLLASFSSRSQTLPLQVFLDIGENYLNDTVTINKLLKGLGMRQIRDGKKGDGIQFGAWTDSTSAWEKDGVTISKYSGKPGIYYVTYTKKIYDTWPNELLSAGFTIVEVKKHKQSTATLYSNGKLKLVMEKVTIHRETSCSLRTHTGYF